MTPWMWALLPGALVGAGAFCWIWMVLPPAPVRLDEALALRDAPPVSGADPAAEGLRGWLIRHGAGLVRVRPADLDLLDESVGDVVVRQATAAAAGAALSFVLALAAGSLHVLPGLSAQLLVLIVVAVAAVFAVLPLVEVHTKAITARRGFEVAVTSYYVLVTLERGAGAGAADALLRAAEVTDSGNPAFARIHGALLESKWGPRPPWEALSDLGQRLDVQRLIDLADIMEQADDGGAVVSGLVSKVDALRDLDVSVVRGKANARSESMTALFAIPILGLLLVIGFPPVIRLLGMG